MILKRHGVNRISLGVQTLDDNLLKLLNRKHESKDVLKVIEMIHECGIHNISIDMMYALPFQSVDALPTIHLQATIADVLAQLSTTDQLIVEDNGTPIGVVNRKAVLDYFSEQLPGEGTQHV